MGELCYFGFDIVMARIFISYSHKDEALRAELDKHLSLLKRQGLVEIWNDHRIPPGKDLNTEINAALESAHVFMLLVSADFLASDYCFGIEMDRGMQRHQNGTAVVLPVILRPCDWQSAPFGKLKALPKDGRPVVKWPSQDDAFLDIVQGLRGLLSDSNPVTVPLPPTVAHASPPTDPKNRASPLPRSSYLALPREFTDQDKHDFAETAFDYILAYFMGSLEELESRNGGIKGKLRKQSGQAFTVVVFRNGKRIAGCSIRLGGMGSSTNIAYSSKEDAALNSYNEVLSVGTDDQNLFLEAMMGMFGTNGKKGKLSEEGAAEHLWSMLLAPIQAPC
jgi:hypothetical protein